MRNNLAGGAGPVKIYLSAIILTVFAFLFNGCADNPSSLGLKFIPPGDTTGIRIFDSYRDTLPITFSSKTRHINTSNSGNLIVGQNANYNSKGLIKFTSIDANHDSATVNSATLTLKYRNYYFPNSTKDSLAPISFDVFLVQQNINYTNFTADSVTSSTFGTVSEGSYTGSPTTDSQQVVINLNTQMVKNWLIYAQNPNYSVVNNGIALIPNGGSFVLKAFYSAVTNSSVQPLLTIITTQNNVTDTLKTTTAQSFSLVTGTITPGKDVFAIQAGIAFTEIMKFDISRIPSTATINDVQVYLTLDSADSKFTSQTTETIVPAYLDDTSFTTIESLPGSYNGSPVSSGSSQFLFRIIYPFQRWLQGQANYGLLFTASNQNLNLDLFYFYNTLAADPNKRPHVIIKYTPRIVPGR